MNILPEHKICSCKDGEICIDDCIVNYKDNPNWYDGFANLLEREAFNCDDCEKPIVLKTFPHYIL